MLKTMRQLGKAAPGRVVILLLALLLWPSLGLASMACCADEGVAGGPLVDAAGPAPCHGPSTAALPDTPAETTVSNGHADCDSLCASRCASPSFGMTVPVLATLVPAETAWPVLGDYRAPTPQRARLLRPPITA